MEFVIPSFSNPNGGKPKATLSEQMDENAKYLKKLHDDMMRQVNTVNNQTIKNQPMDIDLINRTQKYPQKIKLEPLTRIFPNILKQFLPNFLNPFNFFHGYERSRNDRDLISNMNMDGNMGHLKTLMKHMANDVLTANKAMGERQQRKQKEDMNQTKTKTKEKN